MNKSFIAVTSWLKGEVTIEQGVINVSPTDLTELVQQDL